MRVRRRTRWAILLLALCLLAPQAAKAGKKKRGKKAAKAQAHAEKVLAEALSALQAGDSSTALLRFQEAERSSPDPAALPQLLQVVVEARRVTETTEGESRDWAGVILCRGRRLAGELEEGSPILGEPVPETEAEPAQPILYAVSPPSLPREFSGKKEQWFYSYHLVIDREGCVARYSVTGGALPEGLHAYAGAGAKDKIYHPARREGEPVAIESRKGSMVQIH